MNERDNPWSNRPPMYENERVRPRTFWQRHRWQIIAIISFLFVIILGSTTVYLWLRPSVAHFVVAPTPTALPATKVVPTQAAAATGTPPLGATTVSSTPAPTTNLSSTTTNYSFVCLNPCSGKLGVVLTDIKIDPTAQTMIWDFNITNNGSCSSISGNLSLEAPTGDKLNANGGTFGESIDVNSGQQLPRSATFSSVPKQGVQYTVTLGTYCGSVGSDSYQPVLFTY
jgi:hypothetical protein